MQDVLATRPQGGVRQFLIRWKGYTASANTWEPESHLDHRLVTEFLESRIGLQEETDDDEEQAQEENDGDGCDVRALDSSDEEAAPALGRGAKRTKVAPSAKQSAGAPSKKKGGHKTPAPDSSDEEAAAQSHNSKKAKAAPKGKASRKRHRS